MWKLFYSSVDRFAVACSSGCLSWFLINDIKVYCPVAVCAVKLGAWCPWWLITRSYSLSLSYFFSFSMRIINPHPYFFVFLYLSPLACYILYHFLSQVHVQLQYKYFHSKPAKKVLIRQCLLNKIQGKTVLIVLWSCGIDISKLIPGLVFPNENHLIKCAMVHA